MSDGLRKKALKVLEEAKKVVYGQDGMLEGILCALVCEGHLLIEGMPGLGKTLSVSTMGRLCHLNFNRIQFTPDLLPSDLVGTMVYSQQKEEFTTKFGPIFTQMLLADEINRSPAKVQSALLEAMAERQVTIGEESHKLTRPFVVLATQNPVDQEGTYPLPEAQMDRFMTKIHIDYPSFEAEKKVLDLSLNKLDNITPILSTDDILQIKSFVDDLYVDEKIKDLIVKITHSTRPDNVEFVKRYKGAILAGVSPRASIWLYRISKFKAFMKGRDFVSPEDIIEIAPDVLGHRILMTYEATIDHLDGRQIASDIVSKVI
jgi:MoxR-like ATPase